MTIDWQVVLLDLLNTTPVHDGRQTDALTATWLRDHGAVNQTVGDARQLRDRLQAVVRGEASAATLQRYLTGVVQTPAVADDAVAWVLDAGWSARLVLAWGDLQTHARGRLRPCANGECRLFLVDATRAGTARWCSMKSCGNRMKARRHYQRTVSSADRDRMTTL